MKNATANNTIKFIDKKAEYEDKKHNKRLRIDKLKSKENVIIEYEKRKRSKSQKNKKDKIKKSKIYKSRKRIITIFTCVLSLFVIFSLWNLFIKPSFVNSKNNSIKTESQSLSNSEVSTYSTIMNECVKDTLDVKSKITISNLHRNGSLVYGQGSFKNSENENVSFDIILNNYKPYSLKSNGEEYIKHK